VGFRRSRFYREQNALSGRQPQKAASPSKRGKARALTPAQQQQILDVLFGERFLDQSPRQVYATLLEEGTYLGSVSTL
jgi:putative transposase